jgi:hypothetical protein
MDESHSHADIILYDLLSLMRTQARFELYKNNGSGVMSVVAAGLTCDPFTQEELQAIAEKYKKNGFKITLAVAANLQLDAANFLRQRSEYPKIWRPSEERKYYEALCDVLAKLTKLLRNRDALSSRSQFVRRITDHYCQASKELNEPFHARFAELTKQHSNWDLMWSILQSIHRAGDPRQARKKFGDDSDQFSQFYLSVALCVYDMLEQAEQLNQTLHGYCIDALRGLPQDKGGRRKDWPLHSFILRLKKIREEGTAKKAGRSCNPTTQEIEGPFVRFVRTCLTYLEPDKRYPSLEETIHKVLQSKTVTRNGKNLPKK